MYSTVPTDWASKMECSTSRAGRISHKPTNSNSRTVLIIKLKSSYQIRSQKLTSDSMAIMLVDQKQQEEDNFISHQRA